MRPGRRRLAFVLAVGALTTGSNTWGMTLPEAIAAARASNPGFAMRKAQADVADARLAEANAGRLPTVTLSGQLGVGQADLGGFFGFGRDTIHPSQAAVEVRQPLFAGGAINAAIDRARAAREAALLDVGDGGAQLATQVAEAYVGVIDARESARLTEAEHRQVQTMVDQARLRFKAGEIPRSDVAETEARLAEVEAAAAVSDAQVVRAEARFRSTVGTAPDGLEPPAAPALAAATLDEAIVAAEDANPALLSAVANRRAAEAGLRAAEAGRYPAISVAASAESMRDQFFPGYRNDGYTVAIEGRWTIFSGGLVSGQISEARAALRGAQAAADAARAQARDATVAAWEDVLVARRLVRAAQAQSTAAASALDSVTEEVRVGQKPMLDLLTAERESLAARLALVSAQGNAVVATYRLNGATGAAP